MIKILKINISIFFIIISLLGVTFFSLNINSSEYKKESIQNRELIDGQLSLGSDHSGFLTSEGELFMWGSGAYGELANNQIGPIYWNNNTTTWADTPINITKQFSDIGVSLKGAKLTNAPTHSSILTQDGELFVWGMDSIYQLGTGPEKKHAPKPINITESFADQGASLVNAQIVNGTAGSAVLTEDGRLFIWGGGMGGFIDDSLINKNVYYPTEITDNYEDSLVGSKISLGGSGDFLGIMTSENEILMSGVNTHGELGVGYLTNWITEPTNITSGFDGNDLTNSQLSLGAQHSSLLTQDGKLFMWGLNEFGQLTMEEEIAYLSSPYLIESSKFNEISLENSIIKAGFDYNVLLTQTSEVFTWGANFAGQLGYSGHDFPQNNIPVNVFENFPDYESIDLTDAQLLSGGRTTAIYTKDGKIYMWGSNNNAQQGINWRRESKAGTITEMTSFFNTHAEINDFEIRKISHNSVRVYFDYTRNNWQDSKVKYQIYTPSPDIVVEKQDWEFFENNNEGENINTLTKLSSNTEYVINISIDALIPISLNFTTSLIPSTISDIESFSESETEIGIEYTLNSNEYEGKTEIRYGINENYGNWNVISSNEGVNKYIIQDLEIFTEYDIQIRVDEQESFSFKEKTHSDSEVIDEVELIQEEKRPKEIEFIFDFLINNGEGKIQYRYSILDDSYESKSDWLVFNAQDGQNSLKISNLEMKTNYLFEFQIDNKDINSHEIETLPPPESGDSGMSYNTWVMIGVGLSSITIIGIGSYLFYKKRSNSK